MSKIGTAILRARESRGMSQNELHKRAKVPRTSIRRLEAGTHGIRPEALERLMGVLGLEIRSKR